MGAGMSYGVLRVGQSPSIVAQPTENPSPLPVVALTQTATVEEKPVPSAAKIEVVPLTTDAAVSPVDAAASPSTVVTTPIAAAPGATDVGEAAPVDEARLDDGAAEDLRKPPPPPADAPRKDAREIRSIADARNAVRRGETDLAIAGLYKLRRRANATGETQAEIATLLGHLYYDRHWITDALREYRYALALDLRARSDQTIINNTVRALGDHENAPRARRVLIDYVGRSAIPALRKATERPETRRSADEVLTKLGAPRR